MIRAARRRPTGPLDEPPQPFPLSRAASVLGLLLVVACVSPTQTQAQAGGAAAASDAYMRAQQAELREDWATAASLYALADQIMPSPQALRSAARAAHQAGLDATAATHAVALLARDGDDPDSRSMAEEILSAVQDSLGRLAVSCSVECQVLVEGRVASGTSARSHVIFTRPGDRSISATFDEGESAAQAVSVEAGARIELSFAPADPEPQAAVVEPVIEPTAGPADEGSGGLSPAFFIIGSVLTVAMGGALVWSGLDVLDAHDNYDRTAAGAQAAYEDGRSREDRTNALIGVTGGVAVITVVLAVLTDWGGDEEGSASNSITPMFAADDRGVVVGASGAF